MDGMLPVKANINMLFAINSMSGKGIREPGT